jgi:hypothetical protein
MKSILFCNYPVAILILFTAEVRRAKLHDGT